MYIHFKFFMFTLLAVTSAVNAQQWGGVVTFHGRIVQAPCKVELVSNNVLRSSCTLSKKVVTQKVSFNKIKGDIELLSMYKIRYQKLNKNNQHGVVLHIDYM